MSFVKVNYVDDETVIYAQNLNDIQDAIIDAEILSGSAPPTTATEGVVGQLYVDTTDKKIYRCDSVSGSTYTWNMYGGGDDFDALDNRPKYNGEEMTHSTDIPEVKTTTWDAKANTSDIPTNLSELTEDATHRLVTDEEKNTWNAKQNATDDSLETTSKTIVGAINEHESDLYTQSEQKQDKTDNSLSTTDKTVVGAINELDSELSTQSSQIEGLEEAVDTQSSQISTLQTGKANASDLNAFKRYNFFINKGKVHGGYDLGSTFTAAQQAAIANGSFSEMDIGDYWSFGGKRQRIWDGDWALRKGDTEISTHHLVLMTDDNMLKADGSTTHYMNDTDTTAGGYAGTKYRSTYRSQLMSTWASWFGSGHILTHRELLCNAVTNGKASGWAWYDCDVELPSEIMMYGSTIWSNYTDGGSGYNVGTAYPQFALASIDPSRVINRENYWLRDVASASWFADVSFNGDAYCDGAPAPWVGLRPYILLK